MAFWNLIEGILTGIGIGTVVTAIIEGLDMERKDQLRLYRIAIIIAVVIFLGSFFY